jgi:hypothetical protein
LPELTGVKLQLETTVLITAPGTLRGLLGLLLEILDVFFGVVMLSTVGLDL